MHILVIIRNVVDCRVSLPLDVYGEQPIPEGMIEMVNPSDWAALEEALALKRQGGAEEVTVLQAGPESGEESLRWCLASGADRALRIWDPALAHADQLGLGKSMAAAWRLLNPDVVFSGNSCLDQMSTFVPGIAAAAAGLPFITEIEQVTLLEKGRARVNCRREKGWREQLEGRLPALLAIAGTGKASSEQAGLASTLEAFTQSIPCWDLTDLGLAAETVGGRGTKIYREQIQPARPPFTKPLTPDPGLPAEQRLRQILAGGSARKQGEVVRGKPELLAEKIVEFLRREPASGL